MVISLPRTDFEPKKQQDSYEERQKRIQLETERGVIVNSIVKDSINFNQNDLLRDYIIPENSEQPDDLLKKPDSSKPEKKALLALCLGTLGILGGVFGATKVASSVAEKQFKKPNWDSLPDIGRNMNLNTESHFVTYMTVQNPQAKTILGAAAFVVFTTTGFILKNFVDGFKDIWTKKQFAKADYNLQDNLIDVETSIFKGKNEIIRNMMQDTAKELHQTIKEKDSLNFKGAEDSPAAGKTKDKGHKLPYALALLGTLAGTIGLGYMSFRNIQKTGQVMKKGTEDFEKQVGKILQKTPDEILEKHKETLKGIFAVMNFKPEQVEEKLKKAKLPETEIKEIVDGVKDRTKRFSQAPLEMGGHVGKVQYFTYIDDARGHFYNWVMNPDSKPLRALALGITGVTCLGYCGEQAVNATREVEVKKMNNETELNLHKNLVNVELRNFKKKKESYIQPLVAEFKREAPNKDKMQLDAMAQNILYEIKNGPPFVYA